MNQKELAYRITRLGREKARLQKALAKRILKLVKPYFEEWPGHQGTLFVFTRNKDHSLMESEKECWNPKQSWERVRYYSLNVDYRFCGITPDGIITEISNLCWVPMPFDCVEPKDLMRVLSVCENIIKTKRYAKCAVCTI